MDSNSKTQVDLKTETQYKNELREVNKKLQAEGISPSDSPKYLGVFYTINGKQASNDVSEALIQIRDKTSPEALKKQYYTLLKEAGVDLLHDTIERKTGYVLNGKTVGPKAVKLYQDRLALEKSIDVLKETKEKSKKDSIKGPRVIKSKIYTNPDGSEYDQLKSKYLSKKEEAKRLKPLFDNAVIGYRKVEGRSIIIPILDPQAFSYPEWTEFANDFNSRSPDSAFDGLSNIITPLLKAYDTYEDAVFKDIIDLLRDNTAKTVYSEKQLDTIANKFTQKGLDDLKTTLEKDIDGNIEILFNIFMSQNKDSMSAEDIKMATAIYNKISKDGHKGSS